MAGSERSAAMPNIGDPLEVRSALAASRFSNQSLVVTASSTSESPSNGPGRTQSAQTPPTHLVIPDRVVFTLPFPIYEGGLLAFSALY